MKESRLQQAKLLEIELKDLRILYEKGFYPRTRVLAIERTLEQLLGSAGADDSDIARARSGNRRSKKSDNKHETQVSRRGCV